MKLNNRGWGYVTMFFFMGILIVAIIFVWVYSYKVFEKIDDFKSDTSSSDQIDATEHYKNLEEQIKVSAMIFVNKYDFICYLPSCKLDYFQLKGEGTIKDFVDFTTNNECDGHVLFNSESFKSYINCDNYKTEGY